MLTVPQGVSRSVRRCLTSLRSASQQALRRSSAILRIRYSTPESVIWRYIQVGAEPFEPMRLRIWGVAYWATRDVVGSS
jgi:hypothetical protein